MSLQVMNLPDMVRGRNGSSAMKSPARAMAVSMLVPGLGSIRNGDLWKGLGILAGVVVSIPLTVALLGMITLPAFWFVGVVDAYDGARRWNAAHGHAR
jgi:hypothetical protein